MRLDKFLFFVRLVKTRTLAQKIVGEGRIRINGAPISGSHPTISVGQVVTISIQGRVRVIRVEALPERRGPAAEAQSCYADL